MGSIVRGFIWNIPILCFLGALQRTKALNLKTLSPKYRGSCRAALGLFSSPERASVPFTGFLDACRQDISRMSIRVIVSFLLVFCWYYYCFIMILLVLRAQVKHIRLRRSEAARASRASEEFQSLTV